MVSGGGCCPFFSAAAIFFHWQRLGTLVFSRFSVFRPTFKGAFVSYYSNTVIIITVPSIFFEMIVNVSWCTNVRDVMVLAYTWWEIKCSATPILFSRRHFEFATWLYIKRCAIVILSTRHNIKHSQDFFCYRAAIMYPKIAFKYNVYPSECYNLIY